MEETKFFHESWYRIAGQRLALRSSVRVRRQLFRGERWYVLFDPFSNQYYRLHPSAYEFVARLNPSQTVEEVWKLAMARDPDGAPGQEEVIQLLAQLYHANLLHFELPADSAKLFERYKERKQQIRKATLMSIMFFRIPLLDPDGLLRRLVPFIRLLVSPLGAALWVGVVAAAVKVVIDNFALLWVQGQGILSLPNLPLLYLALILIKTLHEFGHAFAVRRFGGEVHTMGVMFLIFNPLPYMDATAAWAFRSKWRRVLVGASGMITELFVAALAVFAWANTGPGLIHSLAYNMIFVASVSTILFNINPLLRFDGYYLLLDLLDIPNLQQKANQHLRHLVERYAFGYKKSQTPATSIKEAFWLTFFGLLSGAYRLAVFTTILLVVADRFLMIGIIMAAVCAVAWVAVPIIRLINYLATSPRLERTRLRASAVCLLVFAGFLGVLYFSPFPNNFKAPGVLKATEHAVVVSKIDGAIEEIYTALGKRVEREQPLLRLVNKELSYRIQEVQASLDEVRAMRQKALPNSQADLRSIDSLIVSIQKRLDRLLEEQQNLTVKAEIRGLYISNSIEDFVGMWVRRGTVLGELVNDREFYFASVVSQHDVSQVFSDAIRSSEVRLSGQSNIDLPVTSYTKIPYEQRQLPSVVLGLRAGGEVPVSATEAGGTTAAEPFYEVRLGITAGTGAALYHGRSGKVRFRLAPEPLLRQWYRKLRQLLQERYQL
jgi:putative peptide zinc metalloprotease protein